jgi:phenylpropionate dioxygenase-like ring-hydroxylating dioxygenase large terminal subunit
MDRALEVEILSQLYERIDRGPDDPDSRDGLVPVEHYTSPRWLAAEQRVLFRELPIVVGHTSELRAPGDFLTHDATGVPLLIVRAPDGSARAFLNVCRHRGSRLVSEPCGHSRGNFVCRYHAWTYGCDGALLRLPRRSSFPSLREEDAGLVEVPLAERCGLLWAVPGGRGRHLDIDSHLGPIAADLNYFQLASHVVHQKVYERRKANWKLLIDAFLEGYHLRSLHRETIARFFLDAVHITPFPPHSRSFGARKTMQAARTQPVDSWSLRALTTPFYLLFPNTILVLHPDWITLLSVYPDGLGQLVYHHSMLIPAPPQSDAERQHWDKTFQLIEGEVFQREDLAAAESIQSGFAAGADTHFRVGQMEVAVQWFHDELARRLQAAL